MKMLLKSALPPSIYTLARNGNGWIHKMRYRILGRPPRAGETSKAKPRRIREGFFEAYCRGRGLDVGYGGDLLQNNCLGWDFEQGDAQYLADFRDAEFDFVYSSHTLEHMANVEVALKNWWRVVKPGGYLILYLPHRDLYEKRRTLPSPWSQDHRRFFLPHRDEAPDTIGVVPLIQRTLPECELIYVKECGESHTITSPETHSDGEYSIELVARKRPSVQADEQIQAKRSREFPLDQSPEP